MQPKSLIEQQEQILMWGSEEHGKTSRLKPSRKSTWVRIKKQIKNKKIKLFDFSYFVGKSYSDDDRLQNYLIIKAAFKYFQTICGTTYEALG